MTSIYIVSFLTICAAQKTKQLVLKLLINHYNTERNKISRSKSQHNLSTRDRMKEDQLVNSPMTSDRYIIV